MEAIAQARAATKTNPTPAQIEAGNYRKGELVLHGLRIKLENPRGSIRRSKPGTKPAWERKMVHDYGYVCGIEGADGDAVDVFIGPDPDSELAVVVDQVNADGSFDESKVLLGFRSAEAAIAGYLAHYPKGWALGPVTVLTVAQLKQWLMSGKTKQAIEGRVVVMVKAGDRSKFVKQPGVRGGIYYFNEQGHLVYGIPSRRSKPREGVVSRQVVPRKMGRRLGLLAGERIETPEDTAAIFRDATNETAERIWVVHMDAKARPTAIELLNRGGLGQVSVVPSDLFRNAENLGTAAIALVHNHPFDDATPSDADRKSTERCLAVADAVGIPIRHHVVVSGNGFANVMDGRVQPWVEASPRGAKKVPLIDGGTFARPPIPQSLEHVLERPMYLPEDVARMGRTLFKPADQTAIAFMMTNDSRVIGVFPIAMGTMGQDDLDRLTRVAIGSAAAVVTVACGKNGPFWQRSTLTFHDNAARWFFEHPAKPPQIGGPGGITYLGTVSVGESDLRALSGEQVAPDWGW